MPVANYPHLRPHPDARYAQVCGIGSVAQMEAYLPANYWLERSWEDDGKTHAIIGGVDSAGWTLDGYVIPRLASGLWWGGEITAEMALGIVVRVITRQ